MIDLKKLKEDMKNKLNFDEEFIMNVIKINDGGKYMFINNGYTLGIVLKTDEVILYVEGANVTKYYYNNEVNNSIKTSYLNVLCFLLEMAIWLKIEKEDENNSKDFYISGSFISPIFRLKKCDDERIILKVVPDYANKFCNTIYGIDYLILNKNEFYENIMQILRRIFTINKFSVSNIQNLKIGA